MTEKDVNALIDLLYPYFIKKYKEDNSFKQTAKLTNGTVVSFTNGIYQIRINPYDKNTVSVKNPNGVSLAINDNVLIMYYDSLKNAIIIAKNN